MPGNDLVDGTQMAPYCNGGFAFEDRERNLVVAIAAMQPQGEEEGYITVCITDSAVMMSTSVFRPYQDRKGGGGVAECTCACAVQLTS